MLFVVLLFMTVCAVALMITRRDEPALLMGGLSGSIIVMLVGIIIYTAKTGGLSKAQKIFLFISTDIQRWLSYLIFPLGKLGYTIAIGRCLFPAFLLLLAMEYSMVPSVRRLRKWRWALLLLPIVSLTVYYPTVFYKLMRNRFSLQRVVMTAVLVWILLYIALAMLLLLYEYFSVSIPYCRRQFRYIVISLSCITFLYCLYGFQDPIQVYQLYTIEYMWFNGMSYANPSLSTSAWLFITAVTILMMLLGFWNLRSYSKIDDWENKDEVSMQRKFDTASMGASVFVHSIKNQLLAARVLHHKIANELAKDEPDITLLRTQSAQLAGMNEKMLQRMEELYRSVKSSRISLVPVCAKEIAMLSIERFHQKYPDAEIDLELQTNEPVLADRTHLAEAIYNLLTNAQDAVAASGKPDGKVQLIVHDERLYIVFEIKDNANGIPRTEQKKIFDPFYTNKNTNFNWGMGLYYVRQIVKSHLGILRLESTEGVGTSFFAMLPRYLPRTSGHRRVSIKTGEEKE